MRRLGGILLSLLLLSNSLSAATTDENVIVKKFSQAQELVKQGRTIQAIQAYQLIINLNPNVPEAYNNLAALYLKQKKIKQAKSILEQGLTAHKGYGALYEGLSAINIALAKEAYSKALQIDLKPDDIVITDLALSENSIKNASNGSIASTRTTAEDSQSIENTPVVLAKAQVVKQSTKDEIALMLQAWSAAWSAQSVDIYLSFYHQDYLPDNNVSRRSWKKSRQLRLTQPKWIKVSLADIDIKMQSSKQAVVNFKQTYQSNTFSDVSIKKLTLYNTENGWQILREQSL